MDQARERPSGRFPRGTVALLQALVTTGPVPLRDWLATNRLDGEMIDWLDGQGLAPYAFHRLREAGFLDRQPTQAQAKLRIAYYETAANEALRAGELAAVLGALAAAGIRPALYKGAVLAHTVYPTPACRPMGDLDLWVTGAEMPHAQAALEDIGYQPRLKSTRPLAMQEQNDGEVQMIGRQPVHSLVELHWGVFSGEWLRRTAVVDSAAVRVRLIPILLLGQPAFALAPEDAMIQLAIHLAINHQMAAPWVRGLVDVALLAQANRVSWEAVAQRASDWRVRVATWLVLQLAVDLAGLAEAAPAVARLAPSRLRRWLLCRFVSPRTMLERRDLAHGYQRFVLLLMMVDRVWDAFRLLIRAIWPEDEWLAARYGRTGPSVRIRHLTAAVRGQV